MITIVADFNHVDGEGRLRLADLRTHAATPFAEIAASTGQVLFVDATEVVRGRVVEDPVEGWVGEVDWDTQETLVTYPARSAVRVTT